MLDHKPATANEKAADEVVNADNVFAVAARYVSRLREHEAAVIAQAGRVLAERLLAGGTVWVFGTGHSRAVAMELAGRAGGLSVMKELVLDDLVASASATKEDLASGEL
ncbi:MAG: SIS domain-containing protein, partial [Acidimicrobiales bacterium]